MSSELARSPALAGRISSIDSLRGLVMLLMLVDHVRERFFLHQQVSDPMNLDTTSPALFWSRIAAHLCAPAFVFLAGVSAWLYAHGGSGPARPLTGFLLKRGLFLIALEFTLVTFSWMGSYHTIWLQVIWAIGLSMICLALVSHWPRQWLLMLGLTLVAGHNLLSPLQFTSDHWAYPFWTILHDRNFLISDGPVRLKVSYPLLPWIGVIVLGYWAGPWFARGYDAAKRQQRLLLTGASCLLLFVVLRGSDLYGEPSALESGISPIHTLMSMVNLTKYPPSLHFLLLTLGIACWLLWWFEQSPRRWHGWLATLGGAPMFFYLLHLYALLLLYSVAVTIWGTNHGTLFGVEGMSQVWLIAAGLAVALYPLTAWFAGLKRRRQERWLRYL